MQEFQSADGESANKNQLKQLSFACGIAVAGYPAHFDLGTQSCKLRWATRCLFSEGLHLFSQNIFVSLHTTAMNSCRVVELVLQLRERNGSLYRWIVFIYLKGRFLPPLVTHPSTHNKATSWIHMAEFPDSDKNVADIHTQPQSLHRRNVCTP